MEELNDKKDNVNDSVDIKDENNNEINSDVAEKTSVNGNAPLSIDDFDFNGSDKIYEEQGYYRYQDDKQDVINRTKEQQRIFEEYFVVKNYLTTTCDLELKKRAKCAGGISVFLLILGLTLLLVGFINNISSIMVVAVITLVAFLFAIIAYAIYNKQFRDSLNQYTAPKKLMSDAEFEKLVEAKMDKMNIEQRSVDRICFEPKLKNKIQPIVVRDKVIDDKSLTVYNKDDGTLHSSTQHVTYFYFGEDRIYFYKVQFDMCCNSRCEWLDEILYSDICDISHCITKNVLRLNGQAFEYTNVSLGIITPNSKIGFVVDNANENKDVLLTVKSKIRAKTASK